MIEAGLLFYIIGSLMVIITMVLLNKKNYYQKKVPLKEIIWASIFSWFILIAIYYAVYVKLKKSKKK